MNEHVRTLQGRAAGGSEDARHELHRMGLAPLDGRFRTLGSTLEESSTSVLIGDEYVNPATLSEEEFVALVRRIRAGELRKLRFRALVFVDKPNQNLFRPKPGQIPTLAASAPGALYLVGHRQWREEARVGTVAAGSETTSEGNDALVLDIDITDPGAQERFLRGEQDRFSIGWDSEDCECSVCGSPARFSWWDGWKLKCDHAIGEMNETDDGEVLGEVFWTGVTLIEVSTVNFPAVSGTAILSQLCRPAGLSQGATPESEDTMEEKTLAELEREKQELAKELEKLRAQAEADRKANEEELAKANEQIFQSLFTKAIDEGRIDPREERLQRIAFTELGADEYAKELAHRAPNPVYEGARGALAGDPGGAAGETRINPEAEALRWCQDAYRNDILQVAPTEEKVRKVLSRVRLR